MAMPTIPQLHPKILLLLNTLGDDFAKADKLFVTAAEHITKAEKALSDLRELFLTSAQTCYAAKVECKEIAER